MATAPALPVSLEAVCAARAASMAASKQPLPQFAAPPQLLATPPSLPPRPHSARDAWLLSAAARRRLATCALRPQDLRTLLEQQGPLHADFEERLACCLHAAAAEAPAVLHKQQATGVQWLGEGAHPRTQWHPFHALE